MDHTQWSSPIPKVVVEHDLSGLITHVWLHRDISSKQVLQEGSQEPYTVYEADELYLKVAGTPTEAEVLKNFDALWDEAERASRSLDDRVTTIEESLSHVILSAGDL